MSSFLRIYIFALALMCAHSSAAQDEWTLEKEQAGIEVYTRSLPGWSVREFRGVVEIEARIESLRALLDDSTSCPRWIHNCISSELLEQPDPDRKYYYIRNKAPWPVRKRDTILVTTTTLTNDRVEIVGIAKPDYRPRQKKFVRIPKQEVRWYLTPMEDGNVQVVFETRFEPGGSVPKWAVNRTLIETPYQTLKKMRQVLQEPKYRDANLKP